MAARNTVNVEARGQYPLVTPTKRVLSGAVDGLPSRRVGFDSLYPLHKIPETSGCYPAKSNLGIPPVQRRAGIQTTHGGFNYVRY
jgi:hypothetical protein